MKQLIILALCLFLGGMGACSKPQIEDLKDLSTDDLPTAVRTPSSAKDLDEKIQNQCNQETKNSHNVLKCKARYTQNYCRFKGGTWKEFPNGCKGDCPPSSGTPTCTSAITYGCGCPEGYCWAGTSCQSK